MISLNMQETGPRTDDISMKAFYSKHGYKKKEHKEKCNKQCQFPKSMKDNCQQKIKWLYKVTVYKKAHLSLSDFFFWGEF